MNALIKNTNIELSLENKKDFSKGDFAFDVLDVHGDRIAIKADDENGNSQIAVFNTQNGELENIFNVDGADFQRACFSRNGKLLASISEEMHAIIIWDVLRGIQLNRIKGRTYEYRSVQAPRFIFKNISYGFTIRKQRYDLKAGDMRFSPCDCYLYWSVENGEVNVLNLKTLKRRVLFKEEFFVKKIDFCDQGKTLVCVGYKERKKEFNFSTGMNNPDMTDIHISFHNSCDGTIVRDIVVLQGHISQINDMSFSPGISYAASGSKNGSVLVHEVHSSELYGMFNAHKPKVETTNFLNDFVNYPIREDIYHVDFSENCSWIAAGMRDGRICIGDWTSCEEIAVIRAHQAGIEYLKFLCSGTKLLSICRRGRMCLWDMSSVNLVPMWQAELEEALFL